LVDHTQSRAAPLAGVKTAQAETPPAAAENVPYDKRKLSYASTFTNPWSSFVI